MRSILAATVLMASSACMPYPRPEQKGMPQTGCDVSVHFGSYAMGIDAQAAAAVEQLIAGDPAVAGVTRSGRGIEGEYALCLQTRSRDEAMRLFEKLRRSLGGGVRAPVTLKGPRDIYLAPFPSRN